MAPNDSDCFGCLQLVNKTDDTLFDDSDKGLACALASDVSRSITGMRILLNGKVEDVVAVLSVGIHGLDGANSRNDIMQNVRILNRLISFVIEETEESDGHTNKYYGDTIMVYWVGKDAVVNACNAAISMMKDFPVFRENIKKTFKCNPGIGIGISCGESYVGHIGTSSFSDYTLFGNTVNESAFLGTNAPKNKIYVTKEVLDASDMNGNSHKISPFLLKNQKLHCPVYSLEY